MAIPLRLAVIQAPLRVGLCQVLVGRDKLANLARARAAVAKAVEGGANLVSLPECFNSPYSVSDFAAYAESVPCVGTEARAVNVDTQPSTHALVHMAQEHEIYLVGGSIPELGEDGRLFNTCVVASPFGQIVAKHRKIHLFDIDIPGGIRFQESETLSPGDSLSSFETPWCKVGLGICYDMRFPQLAALYREQGCKLLIYPGAFNTTTGPAHWELLIRSRAVDNQLFVAAVSPARNPESDYKAWGHTTLSSPWGEVLVTTEHDEAVLVSQELDLEHCDRVRNSVPISKQVRRDLYRPVEWISPLSDAGSPVKRVKASED